MKECIFCKIAKKEVTNEAVIDENKDFIAFLDIDPITSGHTLVIPKKHYTWIWDIPNFGEYAEFCKKIANTLKKALNAELITMGTKGTDVPHAHIHILPWLKGEKISFSRQPKKTSTPELNTTADKIRKFL